MTDNLPGRGKQLAGLLIWIAIVFAVATAASQFRPDSWYANLDRPVWTPPNWVFGPVWTMLYLLMAVAVWRIWRLPVTKERSLAISVFIAQLILNGLWSFLFFGLQSIAGALIDIVLLACLIVYTLVLFRPLDRPASILLWPYLVWVAYASTLNFGFWLQN